jgi:hypothetical protein
MPFGRDELGSQRRFIPHAGNADAVFGMTGNFALTIRLSSEKVHQLSQNQNGLSAWAWF